MNINVARVSLAAGLIGLVVGCANQNAPANDMDIVSGAAEIAGDAREAAVISPGGVVAVSDYDTSLGLEQSGNCAIDAINGASAAGATVKVGSEVLFGGWIADGLNRVPTHARLVLNSGAAAYAAPLVADVERLDVAAALQADELKFSGYNVLAKLDVTPGSYELSIVHGSPDKTASCTLNTTLVVTD